jgi:small subunit ribosomal protein S16
MRVGKKKQPYYRVVAADARSPRDGRFIEIVGTYDPRQEPSAIDVKADRAVHWLRHGAQPTERVRKLLEISGAWGHFQDGKTPEELAEARAEAVSAAAAEA